MPWHCIPAANRATGTVSGGPAWLTGANIPYGMVRGGSCNGSADAAEGTIPSISPIAAAATAPAIHRRRIRNLPE